MDEQDPHLKRLAKILQDEFAKPGWNLQIDDFTARQVARTWLQGDEVCSTRFSLPRKYREDAEVWDARLEHVKVSLYRQILRIGAIPAGPLRVIEQHLKHMAEVPPELDDWDMSSVWVSCRVWMPQG